MSRRSNRQLEREVPEMSEAIRSSRGDGHAAMAVDDHEQEEGIVQGGDLMIQRFEKGKKYWVETATWVYVGKVLYVGRDYIEFEEASRMPLDGRHSVMMATGTAPGIEWEPTGGPKRRIRIPIDWIGMNCEWVFAIPDHAV